MANLEPLLELMQDARERFSGAARAVPEPLWRIAGQPGAWSAAEVVAHVTMVETLMTGAAAKITRTPAQPVPLWKRLHLPVVSASWRMFRVKSPIPLDTLLLDDRELMLSRLAGQRQRTLAFLQAGRDTNYRDHRINHPVLGSLNYYEWFRTLAYHDVRHAKQLRELAKTRGAGRASGQ